jgi:hypothetical protein
VIATKLKRRRRLLLASAAAVPPMLGLLTASTEAADSANASRYPYDPVCAWGRIADGRGMLVRCLTRTESESLRTRSPDSPQAPVAGGSNAAAPAPAAAAPAGAAQRLQVAVGPVLVENGKLPAAERKLQSAEARFMQCVTQHGGLAGSAGEVRVRFLVRERGRAEGVGVTRRRSVSKSAAQCIADVVDRRDVGLPDVPIVAATLVVKFERQTK